MKLKNLYIIAIVATVIGINFSAFNSSLSGNININKIAHTAIADEEGTGDYYLPIVDRTDEYHKVKRGENYDYCYYENFAVDGCNCTTNPTWSHCPDDYTLFHTYQYCDGTI